MQVHTVETVIELIRCSLFTDLEGILFLSFKFILRLIARSLNWVIF